MSIGERKVTTPDRLARHWGCSPNHVRNLIHSGQLRAFKLGERLWRIPIEAIDEFEQQHMNEVIPDREDGL